MDTLSVIIITKNEAHDIRDCLESVKWADEIIVFDAGSTDDTVKICREYTDHVFVTADWPGFGAQKARALAKATQDWVLNLDADERLSLNLQDEIKQILARPDKPSAYKLKIATQFAGKTIKHGTWGNKYHLRLFDRKQGQIPDREVHEKIIINGAIDQLKQPIIHRPYQDVEEWLTKINRYSTASAQLKHRQGRSSNISIAMCHAVWIFCKSYLLKAGFLDGREGFIIASMSAYDRYIRYIKLYYLGKKPPCC